MSCSEFDLKGYVLGEAAEAERRGVEGHVGICAACREELERLLLTQAALRNVPDEEIPRRIAFVSDKVFEPRWWQRLWQPGPRWAFVSAALVAAAILVHGFTRPPVVVQTPGPDVAVIEAMVEREVARRVGEAVSQAAALQKAQQEERTANLLREAREEFEMRREQDRAQVQQAFEVLNKRLNVMHLASAYQER